MAKLQADANTVDQVHTDSQGEVEGNEREEEVLNCYKTLERLPGPEFPFLLVIRFLRVRFLPSFLLG